MDNFSLLIILLSTIIFANAQEIAKDSNDDSGVKDATGDSFPHITVGSSVGSVLCIVFLVWLIYYLCCRNKAPEGFTQFSNENGGTPRRRHWRWRRRFWRRNRRQNYGQNQTDPRQPTQVIIQTPIVVAVPSHNQHSGAPANDGTSMPSAPPAYDESTNNPPVHGQFINPTMPNQFMNPPMPNNFNNSPLPSNFNNPPMQGNFNNPPIPNNFSNLPPKNPNASSYYTRH